MAKVVGARADAGSGAVEVFAGTGSNGNLVVNRVVTALTGCAMALFWTCCTLITGGNEPALVRDLLATEKAVVVNGLRLLLSAKEVTRSELETAQKSFYSSASEQYLNAEARLTDATGLTMLPFSKVIQSCANCLQNWP